MKTPLSKTLKKVTDDPSKSFSGTAYYSVPTTNQNPQKKGSSRKKKKKKHKVE